jgi:hypothetical protein
VLLFKHCVCVKSGRENLVVYFAVGPITRARSKKIKVVLNGLIQDIWADSTTGHSKLGPKEDEGVINLIQATDGADHA